MLMALALAASVKSPLALAEEKWESVQLPAVRQIDIRDSLRGHSYRIFLSQAATPAPARGYPVLYVLDGNASFALAALLARGQAARSEVTGHVAPVVVGIGYPSDSDYDQSARARDYTIAAPGEKLADAGQADAFLDFIERQVKPLVASQFRLDRGRQAVFGHSFGGLLVVRALLTRPLDYTTYLASSPSIWWQNRLVLDNVEGLAARTSTQLPWVQISVGAREDDPPPANYPEHLRALLATRTMIPEARSLKARLAALPGWDKNLSYHEMAGEDHGTAWLSALARGMDWFMQQPDLAPREAPKHNLTKEPQ